MKYVYLLLMLLLVPTVLAVESQVDINADVYFEVVDGSNSNLRIEFEGYDSVYRPSLLLSYNINHIEITNSTDNLTVWIWNVTKAGTHEIISGVATPIGFTMVREFGNSTELFSIINTCNDMANFSNLWELCIEQRTDFELQIANDMINKVNHTDITNNLSTKLEAAEDTYKSFKTSKETEIATLKERMGELETHRQWGWGIGLVGGSVSLYLLNKYKGLGKRKHQAQTEFPKDVSV